MYKVGDRIAKVSLPFLRIAAGKIKFCYAGNDVWLLPTQFEGGFKLTVRVGFRYEPVKFTVATATHPVRGWMSLKCLKCHQCSPRLFLDWDSQQGHCRKCYKTPVGYTLRKPSRWVDTKNTRFNRLLRERILFVVADNAVRDFRKMKYQDFFALHPYLVPRMIERIREYDEGLYAKALHKLFKVYGQGLHCWKTRTLKQAENDWLDMMLAEKVQREYGLLKGEREWLKKNLLLLSEKRMENSGSIQSQNHCQRGTPPARSSSLPTETASLSSKTPSSPATSAQPAEAPASEPAITAEALETTPAMETPSSAPPAKGRAKWDALRAKVRADFLLFQNSPNAVHLRDVLSRQAQR